MDTGLWLFATRQFFDGTGRGLGVQLSTDTTRYPFFRNMSGSESLSLLQVWIAYLSSVIGLNTVFAQAMLSDIDNSS